MKLLQHFLILLASLMLLGSCKDEKPTLFQLISSEQSSISFSNRIVENDTLNILKEEYVYNGGGVGIGDFNNDGLSDVYFTGNMVPNALYLNQGNLRFKEVTSEAQVTGEGKWCSGIAIVDINEDGWLDIYVSATLKKDSLSRKNLLYVNTGLNDYGVPVFTESASAYGIADAGNTTQAAFFDYDLDGDLDLYLLTNVINMSVPTNYRKKIVDGSALNNDRLYRNEGIGPAGHPVFSNVTKEAGILTEGFGLGITVSDINLDGWPDIYIANDYISNDLLYINNQDGTFTNRIAEYLSHQSYSAMGTDVVDFNNDALVDIIALDMLPESNARKKQMLGANNYTAYINNEQYNYQHQYVRNTLQLNNGFTSEGHPTFSEIGQLSGIHQTDWSWSPLVADFDNDGFKDLIVTNGFPKDVTDRDFASYRSGPVGGVASDMMLQNAIPVVKISNYAFRNNGAIPGQELTFSDKTKDWGLYRPSFSNGAAYADLDNDGDLDFIVNNINDSAFVYENQLYNLEEAAKPHFLRVHLEGTSANKSGLGAKIIINYGEGERQYFENSLYRGYLSSMENTAHFGLGAYEQVDSLQVFWPDGKYQLLENIEADQVVKVSYSNARSISRGDRLFPETVPPTFAEVSAQYGISFKHDETDQIDFNLQRTLPHKYTQMGPGIAVGDVNSDGLDDFYIGGSSGKASALFVQNNNGSFKALQSVKQGKMEEEDMGALFFDADNDGDQDLYVVSGSYEYAENHALLQDRLYLNEGKGSFQRAAGALPTIATSGSCVKAADYDQDGDLDLFVGGRVAPGAYPKPVSSYILRNEGGTFADVTQELCADLVNFGMVADALWTDFDNDGRIDLVLAAEWQPISFFRNTGEKFENITQNTGISDQVGWWSSLAAGDYDNDGDIDYIAGNIGLNTQYKASDEFPISVYAKDFDENGGYDAIITCYIKDEAGVPRAYPVHSRDDLISQMVSMKRKFQNYATYGRATFDSLFTQKELEGAISYHANHMESSYIANEGNGKFSLKSLPIEAQFAPVYGMLSRDINGDGYLDVLAVGNNYATEVFTGRYDALRGLYLQGDGKGNFRPVALSKSGWYVPGDAKGLAEVRGKQGESLYVVTQNQDSLRVFSEKQAAPDRIVQLEPMDAWAAITMADGSTCKAEFYYGSTYLSQSTRQIKFSDEVVSITIYDFKGNSRDIMLNPT